MSRSLEPSSASTQRFAGRSSLVASAIVGLGVAADNVATDDREVLRAGQQSLVTVNEELENLLDSLDVPMVVVDAGRCVRRFTSSARRMVNVIASDIGRPIGDIRWNVRVDDVDEMVRRAADSGTTAQRDVQDGHGRYHVLTVRPYRAPGGKHAGAVMTLIGPQIGVWIEHQSAEDQLRRREAEYRSLSRGLLHEQDNERRRLARELHDSSTGTGANVRPRAKSGTGILAMRERIDQLGGEFDIQFTDHGTAVQVRVPLQESNR